MSNSEEYYTDSTDMVSEYESETDQIENNNNNENTQLQAKLENVSDDLPTYLRFLLSLDECGKIFGPQGQYLRKIKQDNHVKIDITEKQVGCSDRILTCAGSIVNISQAMSDIVTLLSINQPNEPKRYPFYFLNSFLPIPELSDFKTIDSLKEIYNIRLILTNTQISSIIGKQGRTIRQLIDNHDIKLVASRNFLPDSDERILQIQGSSIEIGNTIEDITKTLNTDINIDQITERHYFPHVYNNNNNDNDIKDIINSRKNNSRFNDKNYNATVLIPNALVGAMMGSKGNRISSLRKFTHTRIDTGKIDDSDSNIIDSDTNEIFRKFIISGDNLDNVKKAENLLNSNLESEIKRRNEIEE